MLSQVNTSVNNKIADLAAKITTLQTKLASTRQNDMLASVQAFSDQVRTMNDQLTSTLQAVESHTVTLSGFQAAREAITLEESEVLTEQINWPVPFTSEAYTASVSIEGGDGKLVIQDFTKLPDNSGIFVVIKNTDTLAAHSGTLHALAKAD